MPLLISCPSCANTLQAPDQLAGKRVRCAVCQTVMLVPTTPAAPAVPPAEQAEDLVVIPAPEPDDFRPAARPPAWHPPPPDPRPPSFLQPARGRDEPPSRRPPPIRAYPGWTRVRLGLKLAMIGVGLAFLGPALLLIEQLDTPAAPGQPPSPGLALVALGLFLVAGLVLLAGQCLCLTAPAPRAKLLAGASLGTLTLGLVLLIGAVVVALRGPGAPSARNAQALSLVASLCLFISHALLVLFLAEVANAGGQRTLATICYCYLGLFVVVVVLDMVLRVGTASAETPPTSLRGMQLLILLSAPAFGLAFLILAGLAQRMAGTARRPLGQDEQDEEEDEEEDDD